MTQKNLYFLEQSLTACLPSLIDHPSQTPSLPQPLNISGPGQELALSGEYLHSVSPRQEEPFERFNAGVCSTPSLGWRLRCCRQECGTLQQAQDCWLSKALGLEAGGNGSSPNQKVNIIT